VHESRYPGQLIHSHGGTIDERNTYAGYDLITSPG